ncbi:MAG: sodium/solute symporter [Pseudomonadota bacterium]|nr:sodium/solute symporter [Pseudomonadota bacterium]
MDKALPVVDLVVLIAYMAGIAGIGLWSARKSQTSEGFMLAGRSLPSWAIGLSLFSTGLSSIGFLAVPGKTFGSNWNNYVFYLTLPIAAFVAARFFVPFYRNRGSISAYEHLESRFGGWARTFAVLSYLGIQVARVGSITLLVGWSLSALTGWNIQWIIVCSGTIVTLYTLVGGIEAVVWTDVVQSIVLCLGALLIVVLLLVNMPGGVSAGFEVAIEQGKFSLGGFQPDFTTATVWVTLLYGISINIRFLGVDQVAVQRYHTARSEREASRSVWISSLIAIPMFTIMVLIGTLLFAFYAGQPDRLAPVILEAAANTGIAEAALVPADYGDKVLPHFIVHELPTGITGLLIAAIFAAAMSSVDSSLNSSATLIREDVYRRYFNPEPSERQSMRVLRGSTVVWGVLGTATALLLLPVKSVLDASWMLEGMFSGGLLGLFLLGLISRKASSPIAALSLVLGMLVIAWMTLPSLFTDEQLGFLRSPFHAHMTVSCGSLTVVLVGLIITRLKSTRQAAP